MKLPFQLSRTSILCLLGVALLGWSCSRVPITGRKQAQLFPEADLVQMSLAAYNDFLSQNDVVDGGDDHAMVARVGEKLANSVEQVLRQEGYSERLSTLQWDFNLVNDPLVNAWAMPGGKVVIYTGILPVTQTETGLAVVMGHELAHAIAQHGNERMSQYYMADLGLNLSAVALDLSLSNDKEAAKQWAMLAAGVGVQLGVLLPFSRAQESEADELGLVFMANAGYDPAEAVGFWSRMNEIGGDPVPEWLSTHPSHETRISDIETKFLPQAMTYYRPEATRKRGR